MVYNYSKKLFFNFFSTFIKCWKITFVLLLLISNKTFSQEIIASQYFETDHGILASKTPELRKVSGFVGADSETSNWFFLPIVGEEALAAITGTKSDSPPYSLKLHNFYDDGLFSERDLDPEDYPGVLIYFRSKDITAYKNVSFEFSFASDGEQKQHDDLILEYEYELDDEWISTEVTVVDAANNTEIEFGVSIPNVTTDNPYVTPIGAIPNDATRFRAKIKSRNFRGSEKENIYYIDNVILKGNQVDINVLGNNTLIENGQTETSPVNLTDFEDVIVNEGFKNFSYDIQNSGGFELELTGNPLVELTGDTDEFVVSSNPVSPVEGGTSTSFGLFFAPSTVGEKFITVSIVNSDEDKDPYTFVVRGNAVESDVAFCDPTDPPIPNNNDSYYISNVNFGDVDNTTTYVDPDRYSYFPDITTNLNIGDSYFTRITNTTFVNEASGIGVWIDFNKDGDFEDANEEIYTNLYNANNTETSVESSFSMLIPNDALLGAVRMRIAVSQGEIPTPCGPFNSVGEVEDYDVNIVDLANANPVVEILGNGIQIANGDNTPEEIDNTDFGRREVVGGGISYSFNILNVGGLDLTLDNPPSYVEIIGDDEDFILTQIPDSTIEPISGTRFEITFNPLSEGVKSAIISIANNDSEKDPYTFSIQGEGFIPQSNMAVLGNGILIPVGDTTPSEADGTDYGNIEVTGGVVSHTFSITNLGDIDLVLNDVPLIELYGNTEDFILTQAPSNVVAPNDGTVFTIEFNPTVPGKRLLEVVINNNDPNKNPYSFNIEGFGIIDTYCGIFEPIPIPPSTSYYISNVNTDIIDNTTTYEEGRYSYFPGVTPDYEIGQTYAMSVTLKRENNERTGVVVWIDYNIDGDFDDANEQVYAELIEGDNQTSFTSSFNFTPEDAFASITRMRVAIQKGDFPLACGPFSETGEIEDYLVNFVLPPLNEEEIDVYGNDLRIANGDITPSVSDNTYFGSIPIESGAISKTFQIKNIGLFELDLLGQSPYIILSGDTDHFQLTTPPTSPISVNSNSEFVITFDPSEIGEKSVIVEIPNSDSDENPYRFRIQGNGVYLNDADSDLVIDDDDLDDDNDGILDVVENSDCGDSVLFKTQVFKEDFGTQSLENGTPSITSPYTVYEYLPLETGTIPSGDNSLTDGKYSVFNNISEASSWAQYDWQTIGDHTSGSTLPSEGRMMMFNTTSAQNAEYYRRELTNVEAGVPVDVSFWVLNLDIDSQDNSGRILPDIEVVIEQGGNSYSIVRSGGIPRESAGDITAWKNFTGSFIPNSTAVITIVFIDRAGSGNGNELAIDDIEVSQTQAICDVDGDGIPNKFDIDSDNDGIYDVIEAGGLDANNNGLADDDDDNSDNTSTLGIPTSAGTGFIPVETTPGNPNYVSLDSDLDSCFDVIEVYGKNADPDGDGIFGEGLPSVLDNGKVADLIYISPPDADGDLVQDYVQVSKNIVGIIRNPFEAIVLEGTNVVLSVEVDIQGEGTDVVYQWQEDRGAGFENLLNDGKYSGVHTELVRIENVTYDMTGYEYRVLIESPSYACDEDLISDEAELIIKASDLVTEKSIDNINPYVGDEILYSIIVSNMGPQEATNVSIVDVLPVEVTYVSDNVSGSYNPIDGLWTIGNLSVGSSVTLLINATVNINAVATVRNQITQVNLDELDLTTNGDVLFADFIVNTVPNANNDAVTVAEDSGLTNIDVTSNDDFGGDGPSTSPIELISGSTAQGGTVVVNDNGTPTDPTDDMVGYTPKLDFNGTDSFDYKIYDIDGDVSTATVTVTVTSVNDVPMAVDDDFVTILEDSVDEIIVILENDDFGGDGPGTLVLATLPSNGTAVIDDRSTPEVTDDVVIYNPTLDYFGSDSFTYTISDSDGDTSTATVTITINPVNDEPLAGDDTATTDEDTPLNIAVLVNDDFGGDGPSVGPIEVTSASTSQGGTVVVNENGTPDNPTDDTIDYTPAQDFNGTDTFDYNILDVDGDISSATVTITVNPINDLPVAVDDTATMDEDGPAKTIPVAYNDDFGGDGPSATAIVVATAPSNGITTVDDNGTPTNPTDDFIIYTPNANYHGVDTIDYTIADSNGDTSTATVTITINSINDLPTANNDAVTVAEDSGLTNIDVTSNDDFGGDGPSTAPIELVSGSTAQGGTVVVNDNGTPTDPTDDMVGYTPKLNFYGTDSFDYKIYDVDGDVSTATVTVTVTFVNDVPMAVDDDFVTILEDSVDEIIVILENDDFGGDGPGTLILATLPSNGTAVIDDRSTPEVTDDVVIYNPTLDYFGSDSFTYTISDSDGDTSTATVTITINPVNDEPLAGDDTATTNEDTPLNIAVLVNDDFGGDGPSVGPIEVTSASTSKGGTVVVNENGTPDNPTDDTIDYTPAQDFNGTDTFDYNILDVDGDISSATVTITVNPINDLPTAVDDTATMDEDGPAKTIPVAYNDDFGGDGPSTTAIVIATAPSNGITTVDDNGTPTNPTDDFIIYTPNANYHGVDTIDYTIADSNGDTSTATVTITINSINDLPTANNDAVTVAEDSGLTNIAVTSNDDFGGDGPSSSPIELVSGSTAQGGTVVVNDNGTPTDPTDDMIGYTPKLDFYGTDSFDYRIYDSNGDLSVATVSVTVTSVNDIPIAGNDPNVVIVEDRIDAVLYLLNNDDFGGDGPGTVSLTTLPPNGTVAIDDLGTPDVLDDVFIYSPTPDYNGPDGFTYTITDSDGDASTATVTIEITPVDDFPLATDDTATTDEDTPLNIAVLVNDDFGGDGPSVGPIEVTSASTSKGGTVVVNENGTPDNPTDDTIDYTPAENFNGTDTFDYNILDVDGDISSATVTITVNPINDLPVAVDDTATMDEDGPAKTIPVAYNDDFGGDGPSATAIIIATAPTNGIATVDDNTTPADPTDDFIAYTPNVNYHGVDIVDYTISDSNGDTSTATVTITINSINDLPTANNNAVRVAEDSGLTNIDVTSNDDFGGDGPSTAPIELISGSTAQGGTVVVNDNGTPTDPTDDMVGYTPKLDFYGTDSFDYKIYDVDGDVSTATVTVTVTSVNDVPVAVGDIAVVAENSSGTEIIVLANDSFGGDGPGSSAIFLDGIPASNGVAAVNDNGTTSDPTDDSIFYTPNPSFDGVDIFQYTITDNNGDTSTASVVVQVFAVDVDPIASDDTAQVFEDSGINNIDVLSNDSFGGNGPGSAPITITSTTPTIMNAIIVVNDNGTPTDPTDDSIDYTPTENFYGTDGFTYSIMDSDGDTSEATVIVTVLSENDLPTANDDSATVAEDSGLTTIDVTANDDFGGDGPSTGTITIGLGRTLSGNLVSVNDNGTPTDPTDDKIDYIPADNFNGTDSFDYTIIDSDGDTSSAAVTVTVTSVNDLPEAKDDVVFVFEDSPLTTINVTSNDDFGGDGPSSSAITLIGVSSSQGGIIAVNDNGTPTDPTDDGIDYTPDANYHGVDSFDYQITDANDDPSTATVFIEVIPVNDLPTAVDDALTVDEDSVDTRIDVLVNDNFGGDGPSMGSITLPEGAVTGRDDTGQVNPTDNDGLITVDDNGTSNDPTDDTILYSPAPNYNGLDSFTYAISDSNGDVSIATVFVTVNSINDLPQANLDFVSSIEDAPLMTIDVTTNDDFGGDGPSATPITIATSTSVAGGTITVNDNGTPNDPSDDGVDYTPLANYNGDDSFEYTIMDSNGDSSTATVAILLSPVNDLPTANDDSATVTEDSGLTTIDVTANDDFGGDGPSTGTISLTSGNTSIDDVSANLFKGTVTVNDNGTPDDPTDDLVDYTPSPNFNGTDSFSYTITDSDGDTSSATVTVTVTSVNDLPEAKDDVVFVFEDSPLTTISVTSNDDFGGDGPSSSAITLIGVSSSQGGIIAVNDNGTPADPTDDGIDYTPDANYHGVDSFDYQIADANGDLSTASVFIEVISVNDLPIAVDDAITVDEDSEDIRIDVLVNDDFGGDGPNMGSITLPEGAVTGLDDSGLVTPSSNDGLITVDDNGTPNDPTDDTILYSPAPDYHGPDAFTYSITDSNGDTSTAMVTITVNSINDIPKAEIDFILTVEDAPLATIDVTANDDFGGDGPSATPITIATNTSAAGGTIAVNDMGTPDDPTDDGIDYTPAANYYGNDSFEYTIADSDGDSSTVLVLIYLDPVNDLPIANDDVATVAEDSGLTTIDVTTNDDFGGDGPSTGTITIGLGRTFNGNLVSVNDNGTPTDPTDDKIDYTPAANFNGTDSFDYTITDSDGDTSSATVTVTVTSVNDLPEAKDDVVFVFEDSPLTTINVTSNDDFGGDGPSSSAITLIGVSSSQGGIIAVNDNGTPTDPTDDGIDYTPDANYHGVDSFDYQIADANGDLSTASVFIEVIPVNDLPTAVDDAITVDEDNEDIRIDVLINDDFGGDGPNMGSITLPEGAVTGLDDSGLVTPSSNDGLITVDDNGTPNDPTDDTILYSPAPDYHGPDAFTYSITDSNGDTSTATVTITINSINDVPKAEIDFILTIEDAPLTTINVTANDDFGGDGPSATPITIATSTSVAGGAIAVNDMGTPDDPTDDGIDYTPAANYYGNDSFEYTIADSDGDTSTVLVLIYLDSVNDLPTANDDSATVAEDSGLTTIDVTVNDDFGGDGPSTGTITIGLGRTLSGNLVSVNDNGTPTDPTDDKIDYTPTANFNGTDSFEYTITDSDGDTNSATVIVTVTPVLDVYDDLFATDEDVAVEIDVLQNDNDLSTSATIQFSTPFAGEIVIDTNNTPSILDDIFTYVPIEDYNGIDLFDYEICDQGNCTTAEVFISIRPKLDVYDDFYLVKTNTINPFSLYSNDNDIPNEGTITMTLPTNGTLEYDDRGTPNNPSDDLFNYIPNTGFVGEDTFEYTICDTDNPWYCETATVTILVVYAGANDDYIEVNEDESVDIFMLQNDLDIPKSGDLTFELPINGIAELMDSGTTDDISDDYFIYTPNPDYNGEDSFIYTICDGGEYCTSAKITIDVLPIVDAFDDTVETNENTPIDVQILLNDNDVPITGAISIADPTTSTLLLGIATVMDNNTPTDISDDYVLYEPFENVYGNDQFSYTICDLNGNCSTATVFVAILPSIILSDDTAETKYETPVDIYMLDNDDFIPTDGVLEVLVPANGRVTIHDNNTPNNLADDYVSYTPNQGFYGFDEFSYTICDANDTNNCASALVTIEVLKSTTFILPNEPGSNNKGFGFSPNGDGQNDYLRIHSYDGEVFIEEIYPNFKLEIFNRWGDRLYEYSHTGGSNTPQPGWDGTSHGKRNVGAKEVLPTGTYFYTVFFNDGIREPYSGWIYLSK